MPRPKKSEDQKLVIQPLRISPTVKRRLSALPTKDKKRVIAEMRKAVEGVINAMTGNDLQSSQGVSL